MSPGQRPRYSNLHMVPHMDKCLNLAETSTFGIFCTYSDSKLSIPELASAILAWICYNLSILALVAVEGAAPSISRV